jgi:hypothetical protein
MKAIMSSLMMERSSGVGDIAEIFLQCHCMLFGREGASALPINAVLHSMFRKRCLVRQDSLV